jgi:hypothetical protein
MPWLDRLKEHEARSLARRLQRSAIETRERSRQHLQQFAHEAGDVAGTAAHRMAGYARSEGALLADAAARGAARTVRAVKDDPLPVVIGLVGAICLASLLLGRRPARVR